MDKGFTLHKMLYYRHMAVKASIHAENGLSGSNFGKPVFRRFPCDPCDLPATYRPDLNSKQFFMIFTALSAPMLEVLTQISYVLASSHSSRVNDLI